MIHYVCTGGCGAVSDKEGSCQAESCSRFGRPFLACDCSDGKHTQAYQKAASLNGTAN